MATKAKKQPSAPKPRAYPRKEIPYHGDNQNDDDAVGQTPISGQRNRLKRGSNNKPGVTLGVTFKAKKKRSLYFAAYKGKCGRGHRHQINVRTSPRES